VSPDQGRDSEGRFTPGEHNRPANYDIDAVTQPLTNPDDDVYTDDTPDGQAFQRAHGFWRSRHPFDPERTRHRLRDIAEQAADARVLVEGGRDAFTAQTFDGTMRRRTGERIVEIVAEASAKLHSDYKLKVPGPWRQMYGMRTVVVHHHDRTDCGLTWDVISKNIPELTSLLRLPDDPDADIPLPDGLE